MKRPPRTLPPRASTVHLEALSNAQGDAYRRVLDTLALKRRNPNMSLSAAARQSGTTMKTVRRYGASALEIRSGRLDVRRTDHLPRRLRMLTDRGEVDISTTSFRTASRIAKYNNAVRAFIMSGDETALKKFAGKSLRSGGKTYAFVTDPKTLTRLARAGAVHFVEIYAMEAIR